MKDDMISRREAIDALEKEKPTPFVNKDGSVDPFGAGRQNQWYRDGIAIMNLPSAQSDRDIPKRPNATVDRAWGIPCRQAICPNCDCYLGMIHFISESDKTKITYCESCGQAIDWEGWNSDE